jgi:hypothetical protein
MEGRVRKRRSWPGVVRSVGLIGAPGAWVSLGGVHVLGYVRGASLGSGCGTAIRGLRKVIAMLCMPRAYLKAKCIRGFAVPFSQTSVAKGTLCVFSLGPSFAGVILWELGLHEQRHDVEALNRVETAGFCAAENAGNKLGCLSNRRQSTAVYAVLERGHTLC